MGDIGAARSAAVGLLATLALFGLSSCGGSSELAVRLGKAQITKREVAHWGTVGATLGPVRPQPSPLEDVAGAQGQSAASGALWPVADPPNQSATRQWALDYLIASMQLAAAARQRGILVSEGEARRRLQDIHYERFYAVRSRAEGRLRALLSKLAPADRLTVVKAQMLSERLAPRLRSEAGQRIPESEVDAYYKAHIKSFITPEQRNVYVIETYDKREGELARREIDAGQAIGVVVERRNDEPDVGGAKRALRRELITHPYERNYFKAKLHELVGPLKAEIYYLFYVSYIGPSRLRELSEVQEQIRQRLLAGPQRQRLDEFTRGVEAEWRSKTRCAEGYATEQCGARLG